MSLDNVVKANLIDSHGRSFAAFRDSLRPRYARVAADLSLGYVALFATGAGVSLAVARWPVAWPLAVALGAASFGYWMAYVQLFIHEAAHFNLTSDRKRNDLLANLFVTVWTGVHIASYRAIHWEHHRLHGETGDTERSYFSALNGRFNFETLFMIRAISVVLYRRRHNAKSTAATRKQPGQTSDRGMRLAGAALHASLVGTLVYFRQWPVALAWLTGIGTVFPFCGALRQLLEHRSVEASADVDYTQTAHGPTLRMFREGPFGSTFGAAGFTRHTLHHWQPSISYTNLAEVEEFLADCETTRDLARSKVTYMKIFLELYGR
jgi:fatty acid desaturase